MDKPESVSEYMRRAYLITGIILLSHSVLTMFVLFPSIPSDGPVRCGMSWIVNAFIVVSSVVAFTGYWAVWRNWKMAFLLCLPTWIWVIGFTVWCVEVLPHGA